MTAFDGDKPVGTYGAKGYLVWDREPGPVHLYVTVIQGDEVQMVLSGKKSRAEIIELYALFNRDQTPVLGELQFDAAPGRTYYVTQTTHVGSMFSQHSVSIDLKVVSDAEGTATLKNRKRVGQ